MTDSGGYALYHSALTAPTAYQVTAANTLRSALLNNSVTNLNNTGLPFSTGNYTGAWQWNVTINAGQTAGIHALLSDFDYDPPAPVPEPASIALAVLGLALILMARLRTSPSAKTANSARRRQCP